ncbi:MAG: hypothetical protein ACQET3_02520 [Promethearchaeati archaeon]
MFENKPCKPSINLDLLERIIVLIMVISLCILISHNSDLVSGNENPAFARGETITIECYLLQNGTYGDPVPNQNVEFFDETYDYYIGSSKTDETGFASIEWQIPFIHPIGETTLNITFRGNESLGLSPSAQWIIMTVLSSTNITTNIHDTRLHPHDMFNMSVSLIDDTGYPLSSQQIKLVSSGEVVESGLTDNNGLFQFILSCNQSWAELGYNQLDIVFDGNSTQYFQSSQTSVEFILEKKPTQIDISEDETIHSTLNASLDVSVTLSSGDELLRNAIIEVDFDNELHETLSTNNSGTVLLHIHFNESFALGPHTMNIRYSGSERYDASNLSRQIIISSPCFIRVTENNSLTINRPNTLTVTIYDLLNRSAKAENVFITDPISRENSTGVSGENGKYFFIIVPTKPLGYRNLLLIVSNTPYLENRTCPLQICVWSQPEFDFLYCSTMGYAIPGQTVSFVVSLTDFYGPIIHKNIQILVNDKEYGASRSNKRGEVSVSIQIPKCEGQHSVALYYQGNKSAFVFQRTRRFVINTSYTIPIVPKSVTFKTKPLEKHISVNILLVALNGTTIEGLQASYNWLGQNHSTQTISGGILELSLRIPTLPGTYTLQYHIASTSGIQAYYGILQIEVTSLDITNSSGVGLLPLALSIVSSFSLVLLPPLRRKYLIG